MGTNKRYADQIDRRHAEQMAEVTARDPAVSSAPVYVGDERWLLVRRGEAVATVDLVRDLGYRAERFYVVHLRGGALVGYYATLSSADRAVDASRGV